MPEESKIILVDQIEPLIIEIRGQKVLLDSDLANLYGVSTKALNQAMKRNRDRFPADFMFQLTLDEAQNMRSQIVTASAEEAGMRSQIATASKRNIRYQPYVFTEHGTMMAAMVLNSPRAVEVSVFVVRAFVKLRQLILTHKELAGKLDQLEKKVSSHDDAIRQLVTAIRQLMTAPTPSPKSVRIGFQTPEQKAKLT